MPNLKIGDRVRISEAGRAAWPTSSISNPHDKSGILTEYDNHSVWIYRVRWDTGGCNHYRNGEIELSGDVPAEALSSDTINECRIKECLDAFDFKKVEALNRILMKSALLNEEQLKSLAKQMLEECLGDDKKTAYAQSPGNLLVTRQDDQLNLWYAPICSMGIKIEPKPPKCDGIRKLDLED